MILVVHSVTAVVIKMMDSIQIWKRIVNSILFVQMVFLKDIIHVHLVSTIH